MAQITTLSDGLEYDPVGTIYLSGGSVVDGNVDLSKTIKYLRGLERALSYHINKANPELLNRHYSIEIKIRPGSMFTDIIGIVLTTGITTPLAAGATSYTVTAASQLAKNDIGDKTTKEVASAAVGTLVSTMKIAKHRGSMMVGKMFKQEETKVIDADNIILYNKSGEGLKVTKNELDSYRDTPKTEYRELVTLVDRNTKMYVGNEVISKSHIPESTVSIDFRDKGVFDDNEENKDDTLIFPELVQDAKVILKGELTRGNGRTNTLGFSYDNRILKCLPYGSDSVKSMRELLFGYVKIEAVVDRRSTIKGSEAILKKPTLRIISIEKLEDEDDDLGQTSFLS